MMTTALYPPRVIPSSRPLPLLPFLGRFVRNPLRAIPFSVYNEPVVTYGRKRPLIAWVTDPALVGISSSRVLSSSRRRVSIAAS